MALVSISSLLVILLFPRSVLSAFGDDISTDNADNRFSNMGQVFKEEFNVTLGQVQLELTVQDTDGIDELWVLDFQPFRFIQNALPVEANTGELIRSRTGECSSVYEDSNFPTYLQDEYFQNKSSAELSGRNLFSGFVRDSYVDGDGHRNNKVFYEGDLQTFFECMKSDGSTSIWEVTTDSQDEIEYRTKLYATNVRPKVGDSATGGISFVQSHIELIWRLSRTAIGKFIISSTAILKPIFEFAIVGTVYGVDDKPIPTQASLHLRFTTVLDSSTQMVVYQANSVKYTPENDTVNHAIQTVVQTPSTNVLSSPVCTIALDEGTGKELQCTQIWDFKFILQIDTSLASNNVPVDASGEFEFLYDTYSCDLVDNQTVVASCTIIPQDAAIVTASITIQTTVLLEDAEDDQITITLVSLRGINNEEFSVDGARGVLHKEEVTLEVKFSPALLRRDYTLKLMLFMVCRGQDYAGDTYPDGCLHASLTDRYVAHVDADLSLSKSGDNSTYTIADLSSDFEQPLQSQQYVELTDGGDLRPVPIHRSVFINKALSGLSDTYTITTVYRLEEKTRRKRSANDFPYYYERDDSKNIVLHHAVKDKRITHTRRVRDIDNSIPEYHSQVIPFGAAGCPKNAVHYTNELECTCPEFTELDVDLYECERVSLFDSPVGSSVVFRPSYISYIVAVLCFIVRSF
ncbi:uncharacterized protein LOC144446183 [Glandiceps talaboti]